MIVGVEPLSIELRRESGDAEVITY